MPLKNAYIQSYKVKMSTFGTSLVRVNLCMCLPLHPIKVTVFVRKCCGVIHLLAVFCLVLVQPRKTENRPNIIKIVDLDVKHQQKLYYFEKNVVCYRSSYGLNISSYDLF